MLDRSKLCPFVAVAVGALMAAGCGAKPAATTTAPRATPASSRPMAVPSPGAVVHLQSGDGITTVREHGGRWSAPGAVATPDWTTIFAVESGRLRTLHGETGAERATQAVAPGLRPLVSSADGHYVALTDSPSRVGQGVLPAGRSRSTVIVASADPAQGEMRTRTVDGNVLPEGFSKDDSQLFVIEFLPAMHPDRYRVRSMNIATGLLGPVFTYDKSVDTEEMQGVSRTQVLSPNGSNGSMLYTLYSRAGGSGGYDDVHALSLDAGLVHCTDLPANFHIAARGGGIAVSPDGARVYVATADGAIAEIDTSTSSPQPFPVVHTAQLPAAGASPTVALAADNQTVWVGLGSRLVGLASTDLHVVTTTTVDQAIYALAAQPGGSLFAATAAKVEAIAPSTGTGRAIATIDTTPTRLAVT